jgi:hypothetical protein
MSIRTVRSIALLCSVLSIGLLSSCAPGESTETVTTAPTVESTLPPATTPPEGYPFGTEPRPTAVTPGWPPAKLTALAITSLTPPVTWPPATPLLGIREGIAPPYSTDAFVSGGNAWSGYANNELVLVHAGARGDNHQQGVVIVITNSAEGWYQTPTQDGVLRITSVNGTILSLTATDGAVYQFDVSTRTLVSPTGNPNRTPTGAAMSIAPTAQATTAP